MALLLTYCHNPELFDELPLVQELLAERSHEGLIALILQMVARYPDLATLVDRPVPRPTAKGEQAARVDVALFQRQLRQAIDHPTHHNADTVLYAVQSVAEAACDFANAEQWHNASAIYRTILEEVITLEYYPADDEKDLSWELSRVVDGVFDCLKQAEIKMDERARTILIDRLADMYIWDIQIGHSALGGGLLPEPFLQQLRPENIPTIRRRLEVAERKIAKSPYGRVQGKRDMIERLQLQLDALEHKDPEESLQRLRQQGSYQLLFKKLLEMQRVDEAMEVIEKHITSHSDRFTAIATLTYEGHRDRAIWLAKSSLKAQFNSQLALWLEIQLKADDDREALYRLRLLIMERQPSLDHYNRLKETAEIINAWKTVRPELMKTLEKKKSFGMLTKIHLAEQEWDAAWQTVEQYATTSPSERGYWGSIDWLEREVAQKTQHTHPHKALAVYIKAARSQIELRNRSAYQEAVKFLLNVRSIYRQLNEEDSWSAVIQGIRDEFPKLRALQEELKLAEL